ncbi:MAG TPA: class I SAM-dependent methyltransferase [Kouleothrix sp.]|uniref:class I SAM-dependent methyltransferase n=1 Tax=Kouleothrix sp. TaxID=2779161 RepID=UPI002C72DD91|nr:class I SAM-dependent methyltransferase [Kouleothrix sp.]HRC75911.1 class I SAM-dependent methyltransferase [Kouleothrix sp.]
MATDQRQLIVDHYNRHSQLMQNQPWFYDWIIDALQQARLARDAAICDVGCGTGALLAQLHGRGYTNLSGTDFAPACVELARQQLPCARFSVHDIEQRPLPEQYDLITLTGVIDFVADPAAALRNLRASLKPGGLLLFNIRNRMAYWPLYYLRGLAARLPNERLRHWFLWFTTPLGMRRSDQPYERVYAPPETRRLAGQAGLRVVAEHGYQWLPMLWIPEFPRWIGLMRRLDRWSSHLPGKQRYYYYVFVCGVEPEPQGLAP